MDERSFEQFIEHLVRIAEIMNTSMGKQEFGAQP